MTNQDHFNQFLLVSAQYLGVSPEYLLDMDGESSRQGSESKPNPTSRDGRREGSFNS